jgi:hypothetical protein
VEFDLRNPGGPLKRKGIASLRLDHTGREGNRERGSSAKGDDADIVRLLKPTDKDAEWNLKKPFAAWAGYPKGNQ